MSTIAVSRWVRSASAALLSMGALFLKAAEAWAAPLPSDCWLTVRAVESCAEEGEGCWQPELIRHCPTGAGEVKTVAWTAPFCLDESEAEIEALKGLMVRGSTASVGYGADRGATPPSGTGITRPHSAWNPDTGYVDRG